MQCPEASELISLRLDQPLSREQERVLQAHLGACRACHSEWQMMQRVSALFDGVSLAPAPPLMGEKIMARIQQRDRRLAGWRRGLLFFLGVIIALLSSSIIFLCISSLASSIWGGSSLPLTIAQAVARMALVVTTILESLAICLRALLASPTWLVVVGYLTLAGALLLGWTRLVMWPYRPVVDRREPR